MSNKKTKGGTTYRKLNKEEALRKYGASFTSIGRHFSILPSVNDSTPKQRRQQNG